MNTFNSMGHSRKKTNVMRISTPVDTVILEKTNMIKNDREYTSNSSTTASMQYLKTTTHHLVSLTAFFA